MKIEIIPQKLAFFITKNIPHKSQKKNIFIPKKSNFIPKKSKNVPEKSKYILLSLKI